MKTKIILAFVLSCIVVFANAQPVIQNGSNFPTTGTTGDFYVGRSLQGPGPSGADQVWDFSDDTVNKAGIFTFFDPSNTPFASTFPNATHCAYFDSTGGFSGSGIHHGYHYSSVTDSVFGQLSYAYNSSADSCNTSTIPYTHLKFPFNYNDSLTSQDASICSGNFTHFVHYDGYGTLITPRGKTYNNVVRVKEIAADGSNQYYFWKTDTLGIVFMTIPAYNYMNQEFDLKTATSSTGPNALDSKGAKIQLYPNPAMISFSVLIDKRYELTDSRLIILDHLGRQVRTSTINNRPTIINIEGLTRGIYYCRIESNGKTIGTRKVVVD